MILARHFLFVALLATFLSASPLAVADGDQRAPGTLITNAQLIDGSGDKARQGNLLFRDGKIIAVGKVEPQAGDKLVDAAGLILAPGFIDSHSHHDEGLFHEPDAVPVLSQGITTVVFGLDGYVNYSMQAWAEQIREIPVAVNVASYTGHGTLRGAVMGEDFRREAKVTEVSAMQRLLEQEMELGSIGLSTGLEYDPGIYANITELIALAETSYKHGGRYASHMRSEDRALDAAIEELLAIGEAVGTPVHISHIKLASVDLWGQAQRIVDRLDRARAAGIQVSADIYPYTFWESTLTVLMPERDFTDLAAARFALTSLAKPEGLTLTQYDPEQALVGKTVADIAEHWSLPPEEAYLRLINEAYPEYGVDKDAGIIPDRESVMGVSMSEADIDVLMNWPHTNICSDGGYSGHPRGHGAFPRALGRYVRERGVVDLGTMVHKMTGLAARNLGLTDRGLLKPGYVADLVLFDPASVIDLATIKDSSQLSAGIEAVWVNGQQVWGDGKPSGARSGQLIRRSSSDAE